MTSTLMQAKGALSTIAGKFANRRAHSAGLKQRVNQLKSAYAGIESGCRFDVQAIAGTIQNSNSSDIYLASAKAEQAQRKAQDIMATLNVAVAQTDELFDLLAIAEQAAKKTQNHI